MMDDSDVAQEVLVLIKNRRKAKKKQPTYPTEPLVNIVNQKPKEGNVKIINAQEVSEISSNITGEQTAKSKSRSRQRASYSTTIENDNAQNYGYEVKSVASQTEDNTEPSSSPNLNESSSESSANLKELSKSTSELNSDMSSHQPLSEFEDPSSVSTSQVKDSTSTSPLKTETTKQKSPTLGNGNNIQSKSESPSTGQFPTSSTVTPTDTESASESTTLQNMSSSTSPLYKLKQSDRLVYMDEKTRIRYNLVNVLKQDINDEKSTCDNFIEEVDIIRKKLYYEFQKPLKKVRMYDKATSTENDEDNENENEGEISTYLKSETVENSEENEEKVKHEPKLPLSDTVKNSEESEEKVKLEPKLPLSDNLARKSTKGNVQGSIDSKQRPKFKRLTHNSKSVSKTDVLTLHDLEDVRDKEKSNRDDDHESYEDNSDGDHDENEYVQSYTKERSKTIVITEQSGDSVDSRKEHTFHESTSKTYNKKKKIIANKVDCWLATEYRNRKTQNSKQRNLTSAKTKNVKQKHKSHRHEDEFSFTPIKSSERDKSIWRVYSQNLVALLKLSTKDR